MLESAVSCVRNKLFTSTRTPTENSDLSDFEFVDFTQSSALFRKNSSMLVKSQSIT